MSVKPIRLFGDPVLRTRAEEVTDFGTDLRRLVTDLFDTMYDAPGAGLAAPQIGVGLRVFTYWVDDLHGHIVNPVLELSDEMEDSEEGCLSIPDVRATRRRALQVKVTGSNMHGDPVEISGDGYLARAFQHETDHLDGVLFVDHLDPESKRAAMRIIREAEWAGEPPPTVRLSPHATFGRGR
ncbi:MAG: peptide deformylase [Dermatophilus congolensis]|nr:peptide deformylase [Dermatophilus congolensis]